MSKTKMIYDYLQSLKGKPLQTREEIADALWLKRSNVNTAMFYLRKIWVIDNNIFNATKWRGGRNSVANLEKIRYEDFLFTGNK